MVQRRLASKLARALLSWPTIFCAFFLWLTVVLTYLVTVHNKEGTDTYVNEGYERRHNYYNWTVKGGSKSELASEPKEPLQGDGGYYYPGRPWLDTEGTPIQAHGGGVLLDEASGLFYWYGENKGGKTYSPPEGLPRVDVVGISAYRSSDLMTWHNVGIVLPADTKNASSDLHVSKVVERPKVLYNKKTKKYIMWMHVDDALYKQASAGVAISDSPEGPFQYLGRMRPWGYDSRDMTVFQDDDGTAYLVSSSEMNSVLHIGQLSDDYLKPVGRMVRQFVDLSREAPAVFKYEQLYYIITSGCTGWAPNAALTHVAPRMRGPWRSIGDPCQGGMRSFRRTTFKSQGTFVLPLPGNSDFFVFMADRWFSKNLSDSRYVWLPLTAKKVQPMLSVSGHDAHRKSWASIKINWMPRWKLPDGWNLTSLPERDATS